MDPVFTASNRFSVGTSPTDLVSIKATTKPIRILVVYTAHSQTAGSITTIRDRLFRVTTEAVGGTSDLAPVAEHRTDRGAETAEVRYWTAPPATPAVVADAHFRDSPALLDAGQSTLILEWDFRDHSSEEIVLAPGESLVIKTENTPNASLFWFTIRWIES